MQPGNRNALANKAIAYAELGRGEEARTLIDLDTFLQVREIEVPPGFASVREFNTALVGHLTDHPGLNFKINSLSCHQGATSDEILVEPKGPIAHLERILERAGHDYRKRLHERAEHVFVSSAPPTWKLSAWTTWLRSQGFQHGHIHPTAWLSGVYYVSLPPSMKLDSDCPTSSGPTSNRPGSSRQDGNIEFGRAPEYYPCKDQGEIRTIHPTEGTLVLFPSYVYHRTIPFEGQQDRITIAFDYRVP